MKTMRLVALAAWLAVAVSCGSSTSTPTPTCAPGLTQACLGPGACAGAQSCKDDGSGWSACDCGGRTDSGPPADSTPADTTAETPIDTSTPDDTATPDTPSDTGPVTPLSPDKLTGLGLWLDSDKGVILTPDGINAIKWIDQSPIANNTKFLCAGSCSGGCSLVCGLKRLIADTKGGGHDGYQIASFGKIDCCGFDGTTIIVDDDPSLQFGKGPFAFFIVAKASNLTSQRDLWAKRAGTAGMSIVFTSAKFEVKTETASAKINFTTPSTAYRLLVVRGPALKLRVDGVAADGTTATDDLSVVGTSPNIGVPIAFGGPGVEELSLAEYVAVKGSVSDAQVLGVEAYLKAKYKMTF